MTEAEEFRAKAARLEQAAVESFERCDTDGFVSQWAQDITARQHRLQADIVEQGGKAWFSVLVDAETHEWVPSKLIDGRYGTCWALLGDDGHFTGDFIKAFPVKASTMLKKGYIEVHGLYPAKAVIQGGGGRGLAGAASCYVTTAKVGVDDMTPPEKIEVES